MKLPTYGWLLRGIQAAAVASWVLLPAIFLVSEAHASLVGHALAFACSSFVTRLAVTRAIRSRWQIFGYIAFAGLAEIAQICIPNHSARISEWFASSTGAIVGIVLARTFAHEAEAVEEDPDHFS